MVKEIYLITGNKGKILAAQKAFSKYGIKVNQIENNFPEIQANASSQIARYTALEIARKYKKVVVREDHSMFIESLGQFPGPYTSYFNKTIPVEVLLDMLSISNNRSAQMELCAALAFPNGGIKEFSYRVELELVKEIRGDKGNWEKIMRLKGEKHTFSEAAQEENIDVWNRNYDAIGSYLSKINNF